MDEDELIIVFIQFILITFGSEHCQPDHSSVSLVENQLFLFHLDGRPPKKQRCWMRLTSTEIRHLLHFFEIVNVARSFGRKPDPEISFRFLFLFFLCKLSYPLQLHELSEFRYTQSYLSTGSVIRNQSGRKVRHRYSPPTFAL